MKNELSIEFLSQYNPWWLDKKNIDNDIKIEAFNRSCIRYEHPLMDEFLLEKDAIYTLRGSRQIGKSTMLKLLIKKLLKQEKNPRNIFFFPGDYVKDYKELYSILQLFINSTKSDVRRYIFIDEVSFVDEWTRAIKLLADEGKLQNCFVLLTGSLSVFIRGENEFMPGRRGDVKYLDKILYPLSFGEYVKLVDKDIFDDIYIGKDVTHISSVDIEEKDTFMYQKYAALLKRHWLDYLFTGGYYINIERFITQQRIPSSNYALYLESIRGDWLKLGRSELLLKETMMGVIHHLGSTTSWLNLAKESSVQSHLTMAKSVELLEKLFIVKSLHNIDLNKKLPNLRKEKKIFIQDPFQLLLFSGYVESREDYLTLYKHIRKERMPEIVESTVSSHLCRYFTGCHFYRDKKGEVDFVGQNGTTFSAYEVKYQNVVTAKDFALSQAFDYFLLITKDQFMIKEDCTAVPFLWLLVNLDKSFSQEN